MSATPKTHIQGALEHGTLQLPSPVQVAVLQLGLGPISETRLQADYRQLGQRIELGLDRAGPPTQADGGLLAIKTGIPLLSAGESATVQPGSQALVAHYGGTNWQAGIAHKTRDSRIAVTALHSCPQHERHQTFARFVQLMAQP